MPRRTQLAFIMVVAALGLTASSFAQAAMLDGGEIRLPESITYLGQTYEKGRYKVSLEEGTEGPTLVLSGADGSSLIEELAIVEQTKAHVGKTRSWAVRDTRDEKLVRVTIRDGNTRYVAYFEWATM